jgi:hypothetical protein
VGSPVFLIRTHNRRHLVRHQAGDTCRASGQSHRSGTHTAETPGHLWNLQPREEPVETPGWSYLVLAWWGVRGRRTGVREVGVRGWGVGGVRVRVRG